jgi:hypothetical protein
MLVKGQNSYVDLGEANAYFADRLDVAAWTEASDLEREQALVTATSMLDSYEWIGQVVDPLQPLAFPRNAQYFDQRLGMLASMNPVPNRILVACYELAYHLLNNDGLLDNTGSVKSLTVGPISLTNIVSSSKVPHNIKKTLSGMLVKGVGGAWWRAN